jgi:hypothetical protein
MGTGGLATAARGAGLPVMTDVNRNKYFIIRDNYF